MKKLISFGSFDKTHIIFQFIPIIVLIIDNTLYYQREDYGIDFYNHIFIQHITHSLGKACSFIPLIILLFKNKNLDNEIANKKTIYKKEYLEKYKKIRCQKFSFILLSVVLDFIINLLSLWSAICFGSPQFDLFLFDIIVLSILAKIFLRIKLYKHQYLSILVIFIVGVIKNLVSFNSNQITLITTIISFVREIINCINILLYKYIMEYTFCSTYELCFYDGIFSLILYVIGIGIFTNIEIDSEKSIQGFTFVNYTGNYYVDNFHEYMDELSDTREIVVVLINIFIYFFYYLFPLLVIKNYSVFHYLIIFIFNKFGVFFYFNARHSDTSSTSNIILNVIYLLIVLIMYLIFNEYIEINCYGLSKDTKRNIALRAREDSLKQSMPLLNIDVNDSVDSQGYDLNMN